MFRFVVRAYNSVSLKSLSDQLTAVCVYAHCFIQQYLTQHDAYLIGIGIHLGDDY